MRKRRCSLTRCSSRGSSQAVAQCQAVALHTRPCKPLFPGSTGDCSHSSCSLHRASAWLTPIPRVINPSGGAECWPGRTAAAMLGALAPEASLEPWQGSWGLNPTNTLGAKPTQALKLHGVCAWYLLGSGAPEPALPESSWGGAHPGWPPHTYLTCAAWPPKSPLPSPGKGGLFIEWYHMPHLNVLAL